MIDRVLPFRIAVDRPSVNHHLMRAGRLPQQFSASLPNVPAQNRMPVHLWSRGCWVASSGNITDEVWMEYIKAKHRQSQMIISR
jgi:hypothetical protein